MHPCEVGLGHGRAAEEGPRWQQGMGEGWGCVAVRLVPDRRTAARQDLAAWHLPGRWMLRWGSMLSSIPLARGLAPRQGPICLWEGVREVPPKDSRCLAVSRGRSGVGKQGSTPYPTLTPGCLVRQHPRPSPHDPHPAPSAPLGKRCQSPLCTSRTSVGTPEPDAFPRSVSARGVPTHPLYPHPKRRARCSAGFGSFLRQTKRVGSGNRR